VVVFGLLFFWLVVFYWGGTTAKDFAVEIFKWIAQTYISENVVAAGLFLFVSAVITSFFVAVLSFFRGSSTNQPRRTYDETTRLLESPEGE
jgi:hypothetical protein